MLDPSVDYRVNIFQPHTQTNIVLFPYLSAGSACCPRTTSIVGVGVDGSCLYKRVSHPRRTHEKRARPWSLNPWGVAEVYPFGSVPLGCVVVTPCCFFYKQIVLFSLPTQVTSVLFFQDDAPMHYLNNREPCVDFCGTFFLLHSFTTPFKLTTV